LEGMVRYDELRAWFWWRTWMWSIPCAILTVAAVFWRLSGQPLGFSARLWDSSTVGAGAVALALLAAASSIARPWMRFGWRSALLLNAPICAVFAAVAAFLVGGTSLGLAQNNPPNQFLSPNEYEAYLAGVSTIFTCAKYGVVLSGMWGAVFGAWFALRRDKYFIEPN